MSELPLRPELRSSIAMELERLTDRCIKLRESLFKFSWKRLIPLPGFFEAIDYADLLINGEDLANAILEAKGRIEALHDEAELEDIRSNDVNFLEACTVFCVDLRKEVKALNVILGRLKGKVETKISYTKQQYNIDVNAHEQSMIRTGSSYDRMAYAYQSALSRFETSE